MVIASILNIVLNFILIKAFLEKEKLKKIYELHQAMDKCSCYWDDFCDNCVGKWDELKEICEETTND